VPLADLLLIDEATAREIIEEAERLLREAGAVDIKLPREEKPHRARKPGGSDFFQRVNEWALRDRDLWVKQISPGAKRQGSTWRIPATLRGLPASKQDISIHETGIRDFHEDRSLSPIDFVIEFGQGVYRGAAREAGCVRVRPESEDLFDAAFWLARQLGINPADLGWGDSHGGPPPYTEIPEYCLGPPEPPPGPPEPPPPASPPLGPGGNLPMIVVTGGYRHRAADRALDALKEARLPVFVQDVGLVTVITKPKKLPEGEIVRVPCLHPMGLSRLGRLCGQTARWHRYNDKGRLLRIDPPCPVVEQMLEMQPQWRFPPVTGICDTPTLRPDFSLLNTEGYDAATGLWCDFGGLKMPHIPTRPTRRQAETGLKVLLDILDTFPWDGEISKSVAVSGYITPVVRACFDVVPMILLTARTFGTGKTYYIQVGGAIWTGQKVPPIAMGPKDDEFEKRLVMAALEGRSYIFIDNVTRLIEGDLLCQLAEQPMVQLRPLGTSEGRVVQNAYNIFLTGNNAQVAADLTRRTLRAGSTPIWRPPNYDSTATRSCSSMFAIGARSVSRRRSP
jgi:hypothetical protein